MSDTPETDSKITWYRYVHSDFARKLERERNEARENSSSTLRGLNRISESNKFLLAELLAARKDRDKYKAAILECLEENRHLADGEDCTLIGLKRALE